VDGRVMRATRKCEGAGRRHKHQGHAVGDGGKARWACAEEQGEEAKKGGRRGPGLGRETRGKDGASTNTKTGSSVDKKEERSRTRDGYDGGTKEGRMMVEQRSAGGVREEMR
jgi:hypothetical protein